MSEHSLHEIGATIKNYRSLESICKEWGVSISEVEKALPQSETALHTPDMRSALKKALNLFRLKKTARETGMPAAVYLSLEQAFAQEVSANTSLREDRPITEAEIQQRAGFRTQGSLFDEPEAVVTPHTQRADMYSDDEPGYPRG